VNHTLDTAAILEHGRHLEQAVYQADPRTWTYLRGKNGLLWQTQHAAAVVVEETLGDFRLKSFSAN
jgi:hypothetical protein